MIPGPAPHHAPIDRGTRLARLARVARRGLTLIEVLIVLAIIGIMTGGILAGSSQLSGARLKHSSALVSSAVRVAYTRATARSKSVRIVFDFENDTFWIEEGDLPMLVQSKDTTSTGGASAATDAERAAVDESDRILKGPRAPRPKFTPVDSPGLGASKGSKKGPTPLEGGIKFRQIQAQHDDSPRTQGRAYLYFWPGGMTERASIQLSIGGSKEASQTLSLLVSPLTGKVVVKSGSVDMKVPADDKEASDRTEGF